MILVLGWIFFFCLQLDYIFNNVEKMNWNVRRLCEMVGLKSKNQNENKKQKGLPPQFQPIQTKIGQ